MNANRFPEGTTSHPVKAEDLAVAYPDRGKDAGYAVIHRAGCNHTNRSSVYGESRLAPNLSAGLDDYFAVAPCAR